MSHDPLAVYQVTLDWQAPLDEFEQGFFLRESIVPRIGVAYPLTVVMSVKPGGTIGPMWFNPEDSPSKLTFAGFEVRSLDNTEYIYLEQDSEITATGHVVFDGGVGKSKGTDLTFDAGTSQITSAAGGVFLGYAVLNLAQQ